MWPFKSKTDTSSQEPTKKENSKYDLSEAAVKSNVMNLFNAAIDEAVGKANDFNAYAIEEGQGNYYGTEFNIRATAGRIKSTYTREPWVFATSSLIARALSTVPYVVKSKTTNEVIPNHPLLKQIECGSSIQDSFSMNWSGYLDLTLGGNYFQVFDKKFTECIHVPVEDVELKLSKDCKTVQSIVVHDSNDCGKRAEIPYEQVIHRKFPNPYNRYYGLSLYVAASRPVLLDRYMNEFNMAFYLRGATNAGVIETTEDMGKTRLERLMRTFEQLYTGKRNWFRTVFIPKGGKWVNAGLSMTEAQHLETLRENRYSLLAVLGIPPAKVGLTEDVNRATSDNQDKDFWENTVSPLSKFVAAGWNNSYLVKGIYKDAIYVEPDFSGVVALEGTLENKGKQITAVKDVLLIDEIREDILGYEPLPDGRGDMFIAEVGNSFDPFSGALSLPEASEEDLKKIEDNGFAKIKNAATSGQERLETKLSKTYSTGYKKYIDYILGLAIYALNNEVDVKQYLGNKIDEITDVYVKSVNKPLSDAVLRGFSFANSNSKAFSLLFDTIKFAKLGVNKRMAYVTKFNDVDQQAIDLLREEQADGQRTILVQRAIDSFLGFNQTRTNEILDIIASGLEKGDTADVIAGDLRAAYKEKYSGQAFTVARTEILTSISQGIKWNHDVLGEVFSDVEKQWYHVGDAGSNPDARQEHAAFEKQGPQVKGYKYGGLLEYPRDPNGGASETINCRCTMASVIPDHATSNAEIILDTLG